MVLTSLLEAEMWCSDQECTSPGTMKDLMNVSPSVFAGLCRRMGAVLNLTLAADSLNFREANRAPSVCALVERPHTGWHLAFGSSK